MSLRESVCCKSIWGSDIWEEVWSCELRPFLLYFDSNCVQENRTCVLFLCNQHCAKEIPDSIYRLVFFFLMETTYKALNTGKPLRLQRDNVAILGVYAVLLVVICVLDDRQLCSQTNNKSSKRTGSIFAMFAISRFGRGVLGADKGVLESLAIEKFTLLLAK